MGVGHLANTVSDEILQGSDHLDLNASQGKSIREGEKEGNEAILSMSQWMPRAALEFVGQSVLGYSFDPLDSLSANFVCEGC